VVEVVVQNHDPEAQTIAYLGSRGEWDQWGQAILEVIPCHDHVEPRFLGTLDELDPLPTRLRLRCLEAEPKWSPRSVIRHDTDVATATLGSP